MVWAHEHVEHSKSSWTFQCRRIGLHRRGNRSRSGVVLKRAYFYGLGVPDLTTKAGEGMCMEMVRQRRDTPLPGRL
jgi:hypothetical protein